jgi:hypothetical protein
MEAYAAYANSRECTRGMRSITAKVWHPRLQSGLAEPIRGSCQTTAVIFELG